MSLTQLSAMLKRASRRTACALTVAACLVLAPGCGDDSPAETSTSPTSAASDAPSRQIVALGRLEPAGGIIDISAVPGDRLLYLSPQVKVGEEVAAGAELGRVGSYALRKAQLEAVEARLELAKKQREQDLAIAEGQVKKAEAALAQADAKAVEARAQGAKLESLRDAAAIARQDAEDIDRMRESDAEMLTERQAQRKRNLANRVIRQYDAAQLTYEAAVKAAATTVDVAAQNVEFAKKSLVQAHKVDQTIALEKEKKVAEESLEQSVLRAPESTDSSKKFTILKVATKPGGFVTQIPILQLGDLSGMVCVAEVYEADAKEIETHQWAMIRSAAFSGNYSENAPEGPRGLRGRVTEVGKLITSPALTNRNPLAPSDRSIIEIVVEIVDDKDDFDKKATAEAAKRTGLQVTVEFGDKSPRGVAGASGASASR